MSTQYPNNIDSYSTKIDGPQGSDIMAKDINDLQDSVTAIEAELGVNPSGSAVDVASRIASHAHDGADTAILDPTVALDVSKFGVNLLPNSSWQLGAIGWTGVGQNGFSISPLSTRGESCRLLRSSNNTSGADQEVVSDSLGITVAGTPLLLSADIAGPNVTANPLRVRLSAYGATGTELAYIEITGELLTPTKRYATASPLVVPSGTSYLRVRCVCPNGFTQSGGGAAISRIKVERNSGSGKPSPYSCEADLLKASPQGHTHLRADVTDFTHASTHSSAGSDPIYPADIGAETPAGAQAKVDAHAAAPDPHPQYATDADLAAVAALTSSTPTTQAIGDTAAVGSATTAARADHKHGMPGFGSPSTQAIGDAASAGSAATLARSDHKHGMPAFGSGTPATEAVGDAGAVGTAATLSRSDHRHPMPGTATSGAPGFMSAADKSKLDGIQAGAAALTSSTPAAETVGNAGAVGTAAAAARADHVHAMPGTATTGGAGFMSAADKAKLDGIASGATNTPLASTAPTAQNYGDAAAVGVATTAARADHKHPMPAAPTPESIGAVSKSELAASVAAVAGRSFVVSGFTVPPTHADLGLPVAAGEAVISGYRVVVDATDVFCTANATNYIYLQLTRDASNNVTGASIVTNTTGVDPADSVRIGTAVASASAITSTTDARPVRLVGQWFKPGTGVVLNTYSGELRGYNGAAGDRYALWDNRMVTGGTFRFTGNARTTSGSGATCQITPMIRRVHTHGGWASWMEVAAGAAFTTSSTSNVAFTINTTTPVMPGEYLALKCRQTAVPASDWACYMSGLALMGDIDPEGPSLAEMAWHLTQTY